ncbi:MAG: Ig-like domain-containing protein, partial [Coriobacteriia bacterium]
MTRSLCGLIARRTTVHWNVLGLIVGVLLALTALFAPPAHAVPLTLAYPSFTSTNTSGFTFGGLKSTGGSFSAYVPTTPSVIRISNLTTYTAGTAFFKQTSQLGADRSFSAYFTIFIHDQVASQGADGMAFVLQSRSSYPIRVGGGLGFFGNPNSQPYSLGIEFDTFKNTTDTGVTVNDPNNNHIGVDLNGNAQSDATASPPANASLNSQADGKPWNVWVDYNGATHVLEVRMSKTTTRPAAATLSYSKDLTAYLPQDVYVGFTGGTGGLSQTQDVQNLYFNNALVAGGITPATNTYSMGPATVTQSAYYLNMHTATAQTLVATYRDSLGRPVEGATIAVSATDGSVNSSTMVTDSNGQITIEYTAPHAAGAYDVHAVADGGVHADFYITARSDYNVPIGAPSDATSLLAGSALRFASVTSAGYASVVAHQPTTQTPVAYPAIASYQISESDAVRSGNVTVTVPWPDYEDEDPDKASEVKLLHYVGGSWVDVTTSVDVAHLTVTGNVTSLGEFIVSVYGEEPYRLSYSAGPGGAISPEVDTLQIVDLGSNGTSVTAVPNTGSHFLRWDDGVLTAERRELNVRADLSATAFFEVNSYTITTSPGANGSMSPSSPRVNYGGNQTITITPSTGYHVKDVKVNGSSIGAVTSHEFTNVTVDQTISAEFESETGISGSVTGAGSILPGAQVDLWKV